MKLRESNIELLRIVLMIMIITHHVIVHGLGLMDIEKGYLQTGEHSVIVQLLINSFVVFGVNSFVFISGYFGIKFKIKTIISFIAQALFYSLTIFFLFVYFDSSYFGLQKLLKATLPISSNQWWFLTIYLGLFFLAPILNKGVELLDRKEMTLIVLALLYFNCFSGFIFNSMIATNGYSIFSFITIYVLARYMNRYYPSIKKAGLYLSLSIIVVFIITLSLLYLGKPKKIWMIFSYNNPFIILSSVMIFYTFLNFKIKKRWINFVSPLVFGVYLIHDHILIREELKDIIKYLETIFSGVQLVFILTGLILLIFISCCLIELVRKLAFEKIIDNLDNKSDAIFKKIF
jgi:surface polysaccharide O-acyltransferase-like enzyme